jgi:L-ribulose-5-phosphate 3-epimerase UlaE
LKNKNDRHFEMVQSRNLILGKKIGTLSHHKRTKFEVCTLSGSKVMAVYVKNTYTQTDGKWSEIGDMFI